MRTSVLFIGVRSGVGKTSVAAEMHAQLSRLDVKHCWIEGDFLDMAHPPTWEHGLAERNLAAMWENYRALGYARLIYTNTASVAFTESFVSAMGDDAEVTAVLLSATDAIAERRLAGREIGSALAEHVERSAERGRWLEATAPPWVHRLPTDDESVASIAAEVLSLTGWSE